MLGAAGGAEKARDAAVAGVLGAALLGAAAAAAPVSGSAMGAALAGSLFLFAACRFSGRGCGRLAASTALLLAGVALLQVAGIAEGLARSVFGHGAALPAAAAGPAAGAALAAGMAARLEAPSVYPRGVRLLLSAAAAAAAAGGAAYPALTAAAGLAAGVYMLGEMAGWAALGR